MLRNCCPTAVEGVLHLPRPRRDPSPHHRCGVGCTRARPSATCPKENAPAAARTLQGEEGRQ